MKKRSVRRDLAIIKMKEDDIPVYWTCECGWSGSVDEMTKPDYTCPICDDYDLQIFLPFNEDLI